MEIGEAGVPGREDGLIEEVLEERASLSREALEEERLGIMKPWVMVQPAGVVIVEGRRGLYGGMGRCLASKKICSVVGMLGGL
jgi:hypothetical protein